MAHSKLLNVKGYLLPVLAVTGACLLAAGCGGDDDDDGASASGGQTGDGGSEAGGEGGAAGGGNGEAGETGAGGEATGGAGNSGGGGSGGQAECLENTRTACAEDTLIDDGEGDEHNICPNDGRIGWWYQDADETGGTSALTRTGGVVRMYGSDHQEWALMGFFITPCNTNTPYDASAYSGVQVQLTGTTGVSSTDATNPGDWLTMVVWTTETTASDDGGTCEVPAGDTEHQCNDAHFRRDIFIPQDAAGDPEWVTREVRWADSDFEQPTWGVPTTFDPAHILRIEFRIDFGRGVAGAAFDVNIANLAFIPAG